MRPMLCLLMRLLRRPKLNKKIEMEEGIDLAVGDSVIVIKENGKIGQVFLPEITEPTKESKGYKLTLNVLEFIDKENGSLIRSETNRRRYN